MGAMHIAGIHVELQARLFAVVMTQFSRRFFRLCMLAGLLLFAGGVAGTATGQTGPGGVGTDDGTSDLRIWLQVDELSLSDGDGVDPWADGSGYGNDATQPQSSSREPTFKAGGLSSGKPAVSFDGSDDYLEFPGRDYLEELNGQGLTVFVVNEIESWSGKNQCIICNYSNFNGKPNPEQDWYFSVQKDGDAANELAAFLERDDGAETAGGLGGNLGASGETNLVGYQKEGTTVRGLQNGEIVTTDALSQEGNTENAQPVRMSLHTGRYLEQDVAEVVVYSRALNDAERVVVQNYLASKYDAAVSLTTGDQFAHDANHGTDVAGIGQASDGSQHLDAESAQLRIQEAGADLSNGDFLLLGHDDQALSFTTTNPNSDPNARKIDREWRADLNPNLIESTETQTVDVTVDLSSLSLPSGTNDYGLFVSDDDDFRNGATFYDIDQSTGEAVDVTIGDDDYVTIGAVKRTVQFASANGAGFEDAEGGSLGAVSAPTLNATLNYPSNTDITGIPYNVSEVTSTLREDTDNTFNSGDGGQEDYRRTNNTFTFPASAGTGPFNFNTNTATNASAPVLEVLNDGLSATADPDESTPEDLDINLTGSFPADVAAGGRTTHTFSINDDDDPRKISFSGTTAGDVDKPLNNVSTNPEEDTDPNTDNLKGEENTVTTVTFEVALPSGETGSANTFAVFEVTGADPDDFAIQANGNNNELSARRGEVQIGSGSRYGTFDLTVKDDAVFENDETITVELTSARGATLDSRSEANLDFDYTILNDDTEPAVSFASSSGEGEEGNSATGTLQLNNPVEADLEVDISVSGTATGGGDDYTQVTTSPVTIPAGDLQRDVNFTVKDDEAPETSETIAVTINDNATTDPPVGSPSTFTYTIIDNDQLGATGPAGVGTRDGTSELRIWLRMSDLDSKSDGENIGTWPDQSGSGNDATASGGTRPTYDADALSNGAPAVAFDGVEDALRFPENAEYEDLNDRDLTAFVVAEIEESVSTNHHILSNYRGSGGEPVPDQYWGMNVSGSNDYESFLARNEDTESVSTAAGNLGTGGATTLVGFQKIGTTVRALQDGANRSEATLSQEGPTGNQFNLGMGLHVGRYLQYDVAEVVLFSTALNSTYRTIIANYLTAKHDIALDTGNGARDVYAGDDAGNGDYDRGVFGTGQASGGSLHSVAESDGLRFNVTGGVEGGDFLLAGHRTEKNAATTADISGLSGALEARSERAWYVDRSNDANTAITVDVTVDLSEAGLVGPAGAPSNYVLIERAADASAGTSWSKVNSSDPTIDNGDEITFSGLTLTDGQEITLATTDFERSPLVANQLTITGSGTADGKDQGWRYLGLPATGATAGDLLRGNGSTFIDFDVNMAYTNPGGDVQGGGTGWTAVSDPSTALTNGRGFILWLYDNRQYPLDPSITLKPAPSLTPPGQADVTVGDNNPSGDDPILDTQDKQFLLANPYAVPFGLGSVSNGGVGGDDFDSVVQIWQADATDGGNDVAGQDDANVGSFVTRSRSGNDQIAPWQGFLLTRTSTGASGQEQVTFNSNGRAPSATPDFVGAKTEGAEPTQHRVPLRLVGRDDEGNVTALDRAASVLFHEQATDGRDYLDAPKFEPMQGTHATLAPVAANSDTMLRAQESRPLPKGDTVTVPLDFQADGVSGTFEVNVPEGGTVSTETPSIPDGWEIMLVDTKGTATSDDDTRHSLTPGGAPYTFNVETAKDGPSAKAASGPTNGEETGAPPPELRRMTLSSSAPEGAKAASTEPTRFVLEVRSVWEPQADDGGPTDEKNPDRPAPPTLAVASMEALQNGDRAVLTWSPASARNNVDVEIQHQRLPADDTTATPSSSEWGTLEDMKVSKKASKKSQSYRYETSPLDYGRHLFRLKQKGGDTTTDPVEVQMRLDGAYAVGGPYPNPSSQTATLPVTVRKTQEVTVSLYDLMGRRIRVPHRREIQGQKTKRIPLSVDGLASGVYFVRVRGDEFATTRRLTVVR
jgi:hypothetical protein